MHGLPSSYNRWNLENPMVIHGEPPPWRKKVRFMGPRLDFEGSLYDDYDLIEPPINFNLDDQVAQRTEKLICDMYGRTVSLLKRHHAALLKAVKVTECGLSIRVSYFLDFKILRDSILKILSPLLKK
jgi:hypothetical protein